MAGLFMCAPLGRWTLDCWTKWQLYSTSIYYAKQLLGQSTNFSSPSSPSHWVVMVTYVPCKTRLREDLSPSLSSHRITMVTYIVRCGRRREEREDASGVGAREELTWTWDATTNCSALVCLIQAKESSYLIFLEWRFLLSARLIR